MTRIVIPITILGITILSVFHSATGNTGSVTVIPKNLSLEKTIQWGYGCGGHCSFNFEGTSKVAISFKSSRTLEVSDTGSYTRQSNYPKEIHYHTRKWQILHQGEWIEEKGRRTLILKNKKTRCTITEESGGTSKIEKCPGFPKEMTISCTLEQVKVFTGKKNIDQKKSSGRAKALVCRSVKPGAGHPGTDFPWVFGVDKRIDTLLIGEPRPIEYFFVKQEP